MNKRLYTAISVCAFLASFTQPAFSYDASHQVVESFTIFLYGWMGLFAGSFTCIAWLANPLFIIALILYLKNKKTALVICLLALLVGSSFLLVRTIPVDEAGNYAPITQYRAGYWLWLGSMGILLATMLALPVRAATRP